MLNQQPKTRRTEEQEQNENAPRSRGNSREQNVAEVARAQTGLDFEDLGLLRAPRISRSDEQLYIRLTAEYFKPDGPLLSPDAVKYDARRTGERAEEASSRFEGRRGEIQRMADEAVSKLSSGEGALIAASLQERTLSIVNSGERVRGIRSESQIRNAAATAIGELDETLGTVHSLSESLSRKSTFLGTTDLNAQQYRDRVLQLAAVLLSTRKGLSESLRIQTQRRKYAE